MGQLTAGAKGKYCYLSLFRGTDNVMNIHSILAKVAAATMLLGTMANAAAEDRRVYIAYQAGSKAQVANALSQSRAKVHHDLAGLNAFAASMPEQALQGLARNPHVAYIEDDPKRYPMAQTTPYGIGMVQADQLSDSLTGNQTVCVIDSGYELAHEDLSQNNVSGTNDSGTGNWFTDESSHGTHVAGTIAAFNNGVGVVGVAPNGVLKLHIIKVFGADGWAYSSSLTAALGACEDAGATIVSMSLGGSFSSRTEDRAFAAAFDRGVLSIAAAGNDGNTRKSYPASYDSVMSVAAIDSTKALADFSQRNDQVEIAAPGVSVLSTVPMGTGSNVSTSVAGFGYESIGMDGSATGSGSGPLVDCGLGTTACAGAAGAVCLIQRGDVSFADKVLACEAGGGVAAIIYNNVPGSLSGTLGGAATSIPSVGVSDSDGATMGNNLGAASTVTVDVGNYAFFDGTSMATPHVAGVAALVWSHNATCSNAQVRDALGITAEDLGAAGRDTSFGYGLVQAKSASDYLTANNCGDGGGNGGGSCTLLPKGASCSNDSDCCSNSCKGKRGAKTCK